MTEQRQRGKSCGKKKVKVTKEKTRDGNRINRLAKSFFVPLLTQMNDELR